MRMTPGFMSKDIKPDIVLISKKDDIRPCQSNIAILTKYVLNVFLFGIKVTQYWR